MPFMYSHFENKNVSWVYFYRHFLQYTKQMTTNPQTLYKVAKKEGKF